MNRLELATCLLPFDERRKIDESLLVRLECEASTIKKNFPDYTIERLDELVRRRGKKLLNGYTKTLSCLIDETSKERIVVTERVWIGEDALREIREIYEFYNCDWQPLAKKLIEDIVQQCTFSLLLPDKERFRIQDFPLELYFSPYEDGKVLLAMFHLLEDFPLLANPLKI